MTTFLTVTSAPILAAAEGTNVLYDAGINTLLGMGMAFAVLILISFLISLFPTIDRVFNGRDKKETAVPAPAAAPAPATTEVESEDVTDDLELYAVIAAAVAAYEEGSSSDGFVVRSIRKRRIAAR